MSRTAIVSGGASGMGLGCARRLARAGHRVAVLDVRGDAVADAVQALRSEGAEATGVTADVADRAQVDRAVADARAALGPITIAVTSAGISFPAAFADMTADDWNRMLAVNLTGTFNVVQAVVDDMLDAGWGRIVTIASAAAQMGAPDRAHYAASKGGVVALTKALAMEFSPRGITANTIPPGFVDTPMAKDPRNSGGFEIDTARIAAMTPVRRVGTADDVGAACAFLCSDDAGYITGQQLNLNGGVYM